MIDQIKYPTLYVATELRVNNRKRWYDEALRAAELAELLPEEIKLMEIVSIDASLENNNLDITIEASKENIKTLIRIGATISNPLAAAGSRVSYHASLSIGEDTTVAMYLISGIPEGCHIETKEQTYTTRESTLICDLTGGAPGIAAAVRDEESEE